MYNVDLNLYKMFYIVAKYNNITKASEELCISQPAVTQAIKKLEEQLNVKLFKRSNKGILLTEAGEAVFYYAEKIYNLALSNENLVSQIHNINDKVIKVGVPTHIGAFYFVKYFERFNNYYPNVRIVIINKKSEEMLAMLIKRELDLVIDTDMSSIVGNDIIVREIIKLDGCFVGNEKFKSLSKKEVIEADELAEYPLILPSSSTTNRKNIDYHFNKKNIILNPLVEANSSTISKEIILQGIGIGWMIKEFVTDDIKTGKLFEIKVNVDNIITPLSLAYQRKYTNNIVKEFIKFIEEKTNL